VNHRNLFQPLLYDILRFSSIELYLITDKLMHLGINNYSELS